MMVELQSYINPKLQKVAIIGTYLPRLCGIATFTSDLRKSLAEEFKDTEFFCIPINDKPGYSYPSEVNFEITEQDLNSYRQAVDFLNINNVDLVSLQHEFGIYGGNAGSHILTLLRELRMPIVTTLHTVNKNPKPEFKKVVQELAELSDQLVVMSNKAIEFLEDIYQIPEDKIGFIHHGIHDVPFVDPNFYKDQFGVEGKLVLLTFGLLHPFKGIENVIKAIPEVLKKYPDLVYIILGSTHPAVLSKDGESYRLYLERLAQSLGIAKNVIFHNRFVTIKELIEFIGAADIYITPYLAEDQITSGTLAYSLGAGKLVMSTPYHYAKEMLADGRGILFPFNDPEAISKQLIKHYSNTAKRHSTRKKAYLYGRDMVWKQVARQYIHCFGNVLEERQRHPKMIFTSKTLEDRPLELPILKLDHLKRMTDKTGLLHNAIYTIPNYSQGYTTDDNALGLIFTTILEEEGGLFLKDAQDLTIQYMAFIWNSFNEESVSFYKHLSYDHNQLYQEGMEVTHGRVIWALGTVIGHSNHFGLQSMATRIFHKALMATSNFSDLLGVSCTIVGIHEYLRKFSGDSNVLQLRKKLATILMDSFKKHSKTDWLWFEEKLKYCNGKLPHALILSGRWLEDPEMFETGINSLKWLYNISCIGDGIFTPINHTDKEHLGSERHHFPQLSVEIYDFISACLEASKNNPGSEWYEYAEKAFNWYLGKNDLGLQVYDPETGGCRDGLEPNNVNQNEGGDSTLSFLLSLLELKQFNNIIGSI